MIMQRGAKDMKTIRSSAIWFFAIFAVFAFGSWGCPSTKKSTKKGAILGTGSPALKKGGKKRGCIRGRVVNDEEKGFSHVIVNTKPPTSPEITNSRGFFKICFKRKIVDKETGETARVAIPDGDYVLKVEKEGFHARPYKFTYSGPRVALGKILMREKSRPLPTVSQTAEKEEKRTSGIGGGKSPKSE